MSDLVIDNLPLIAAAPNGIKRLRGLILELAVRGKLVPQDPAEEPASELLKRIAAQQARLVKEGKIRKPKVVEPVGEDERPFEVPAGWEWIRMDHLDPSYQNGESSRGQSDGIATTVLRLADIRGGNVSLNDTRTVQVPASSHAKYSLLEDDLLAIRVNGSAEIVGRLVLCAKDLAAIYCDHFIRIRFPDVSAFPRYIRLLSDTPVVRAQIQSLFITTAGQKTINQRHLGGLTFPLPPLPEQHRIVARIDELMALCDRLEAEQTDAAEAHARLVDALLATLAASRDAAECAANWQRLSEHFDTLFTAEASIAALKQTVLQLAVMGRLVPQDPTDEPASELLKRIEAEKLRLVKEGKIRKPKVVEPVGEDERPFEVPAGWVCTRVAEVSSRVQYGYTASADFSISSPKLLRITDIQDGKVNWSSVPGVDCGSSDISAYFLNPGDLLIARTGGTIGKSFLANDVPVDSVFASYLIRISPSENLAPRYFKTFAESRSYWEQLHAKSMGTGQPNVNGTSLSELVLPLPPLPEQHRIVAKVDELMALCDRLMADLQNARASERRIAEVFTIIG